MDADAGLGLGLSSIEQYATFEDYLDGQVSETDMFYLEDEVRVLDWLRLLSEERAGAGRVIDLPAPTPHPSLVPRTSPASSWNWATAGAAIL